MVKKKEFVDIEKVTEIEENLINQYISNRHNVKMSQNDVAKKTGIAQSTVGRIETFITTASLTTFIKMLEAIGYKIKIVKK